MVTCPLVRTRNLFSGDSLSAHSKLIANQTLSDALLVINNPIDSVVDQQSATDSSTDKLTNSVAERANGFGTRRTPTDHKESSIVRAGSNVRRRTSINKRARHTQVLEPKLREKLDALCPPVS